MKQLLDWPSRCRRINLPLQYRYLRFALGLLALTVVFVNTAGATQPNYIEEEAPPPQSADAIESPFGRAFRRREIGAPLFPRLRSYLDTLSPFWRDTRLALKPRVYNFDRDLGGSPDKVTFAAGAALEYRSGEWRDRFSVGLTGYTAQKLHGPRDAAVVRMLKPVQTGFGVLGEAYAEINLPPHARVKLYRQGLNLPYFNRQDSRMVPITHEAYLVSQPEPGRLNWIAGHVTRIKLQDADRFVPLSEAAGYPGTDEGASLAGVRWNIDDDTNFGIINYLSWDFMNITYAEAHSVLKITEGIPAALSAQATYQASTGDELGGDFGTYTVGLRTAVSYRNAVLAVAGTYTDDDAPISLPYGGSPSYASLMLADFDRAGEAAWLVGLSYDFTALGIDGLGFNGKYANGYGHGRDADQDELNVTVSYKPERAILRGLWFRARYAALDRDGGTSIRDFRLIFNYEIPLL